MESAKGALRIRLVLGKFIIKEVTQDVIGQTVKIALGPASMTLHNVPDFADLRVGDLITLYGEAPTKGIASANALPTPQQ